MHDDRFRNFQIDETIFYTPSDRGVKDIKNTNELTIRLYGKEYAVYHGFRVLLRSFKEFNDAQEFISKCDNDDNYLYELLSSKCSS